MTLPLHTVGILFITTFRRRCYKLWDQSILNASAWSPITTFRRRRYKLWDQSIFNASAWSPITTFRRRCCKLWDQSILHASAWSAILLLWWDSGGDADRSCLAYFWCRICGCSIPRWVHPLIAWCLVSKSLWEAVLWFGIELATQLELEIAVDDVTERNLTPRKGKR